MVGRRPAAAAFRPSSADSPGRAPSRGQLIAILLGVVVIAAGFAAAAYVVKPSKARAFNLVFGSMLVNDDTSPVAIDLASGKPTVRLSNAFEAVSAKTSGDLDVIPLGGENTLMLDAKTGEFNMVDDTGFVVKTTGGGVRLPSIAGPTTSNAVAAGPSAYIVRSGSSGSSIYLVGQLTVASAIGANAKAKARAYATVSAPVAGVPDPAASANGNLWLLTGAGSSHAITQLSVPVHSNAGVTLTARRHGAVTGVAAVGSATLNSDGTGGDVAAVASARSVQVFGTGAARTLPVHLAGTVDIIRSATNAQGRLMFLYHSTSAGWNRVTAPTSGSGAAQVTALHAVDTGARLARPAESDGRLYTMDTEGAGDLWQINADGSAQPIAGAAQYPTLKIEHRDFTDAEVIAHGTRVIFDARANDEAEVVFSDGSHAPRVIDKHSAVAVDPSGATALADVQSKAIIKPGKPTTKQTTTAPRPTQELNNKVDCKTTTQNPNIPTVQVLQRGARSVSLQWVYPLLGPTDCAPSTYTVTTKVLTAGAPTAPSVVTVQGQNGVTLTHLFPATEYQLTVTAYLNGRGTPSAPVRVDTGPEGPAAPTGVTATADSSGNWDVSWNSCGGIRQACVPSATWTIIAKVCDGRGLSNVPAPLTLPADSTLFHNTAVYEGSDALLGRALCFQVQGVGTQGTVGDISSSTAAVASWRTPVASSLSVTASQPANTALGGSATTTVDLDLGADPARDVGGVGASVVFQLIGPGATMTKTLIYNGGSNRLSATFTGIQAGAQYTAVAMVSPPGHPDAAVSTPPAQVTISANWPTMSTSASCAGNTGPVVLSCALSVQISGLASSQAGGERFDLTDASQVVCGSTGFGLSKSDFDPSTDAITANVNLLTYSGACTVTLALVEDASAHNPKIFGGTTSPTLSTTVDLGQASTLNADQGDFGAAWNAHDGSSAQIQYTGADTDAQVAELTDGWAEQVTAPNGTACGSGSSPPTSSGIYLDASSACVTQYGSQSSGWAVSVSYHDVRDGTPHSFSYHLTGGPPGYVAPPPPAACNVDTSKFLATWDGTAALPSVSVAFSGLASDVAGCSGWTYTLSDPNQQACGVGISTNPPIQAAEIAPTCGTTPSVGDWTVKVGYLDTNQNQQSLTTTVTGPVPQ